MNDRDTCNAMLLRHVIDKVTFHRFRQRYPRLHGKNARLGYHGFGGEVTVAKIRTDQGAAGFGEICAPLEAAREAAETIKGQPVGAIFDCGTGILSPGLKALDIALHDLAGQITMLPVYKMISPAAENQARVYDGAIYMNDLIPEGTPRGVDRVVGDCVHDAKLGHRTLKIKIGRSGMWMPHDEGLARDIEVVKRVHEALPGAILMVDANDQYTVKDAIAFLDGIGSVPLYWFEEPFREEEANNAALKAYLTQNRPQTMIADGESWTDIPLLYHLAEKGLVNVWQPDVCGYGFTAWRALMPALAARGFLASPHAWGNVVKTHYCAHLAAAYPHHIPYIEAVLGESEGVDMGGYTLHEGILTIPERPGFGMALEWAPEV